MNYQEFSYIPSVVNLVISLRFGITEICGSQRGTLRRRELKQLLRDRTVST